MVRSVLFTDGEECIVYSCDVVVVYSGLVVAVQHIYVVVLHLFFYDAVV